MNNRTHTSLAVATKGVAVRFFTRIRGVKIQRIHTRSLFLALSTIILILALGLFFPKVCFAPLQDATYISAASPDGLRAMEIENQIQKMFTRFQIPMDIDLVHEMTEVGLAHHVDPRLIAAIIVTESSGNPLAISNQNAIGLMQINAKVWAQKKDFSHNNPFDPATNLQMGISILQDCIARYQWLDSALAAYVGDSQFSEDGTAVYVDRIIRIFEKASGAKVSRDPSLQRVAQKAAKSEHKVPDMRNLSMVKTAFQK